MIIKADIIADRLESCESGADPLVITPQPDIAALRKSGSASIDLRLGTWISTMRNTTVPYLKVLEPDDASPNENQLTKSHYVPFGKDFVLHPNAFVLGAVLEWIRLPKDLAGYVIGKSKWGRRGLIIATATGVHPGFTGCLTLEITNVGEVPICIQPGMSICQLFLHEVGSNTKATDPSLLSGNRKPVLGTIRPDSVAMRLSTPIETLS
ncbi:MAG: dCTP deaminase [Candidatus Hydrogenedentes bacterium]|nr:dCTP deaminase [Candidatus Hydrogenedentota bacterium]